MHHQQHGFCATKPLSVSSQITQSAVALSVESRWGTCPSHPPQVNSSLRLCPTVPARSSDADLTSARAAVHPSLFTFRRRPRERDCDDDLPARPRARVATQGSTCAVRTRAPTAGRGGGSQRGATAPDHTAQHAAARLLPSTPTRVRDATLTHAHLH
jgi:hypothetical protein